MAAAVDADPQSPAPPPLPTLVIGGYLGAGKTTLVNHLLRQASRGSGARRRIAVLVNDFGELPVDADLIEGAAGDVLALAGGCICCSFGADLVSTLMQLAARTPRPDALLIETSGVALPAAVARTARLAPPVALEGVVVVADATAVRRQARERHVGETVLRQLHEADLLVIGKTDLVGEHELASLRRWLMEAGIEAPGATMPSGADEDGTDDWISEVIFGLRAERGGECTRRHEAAAARPLAAAGHAPAAARYSTRTRRFAQPVDVAALARALQAEGVLRAKGLLRDMAGQWQELHVMGRRADVRPARRPPVAGPDTACATDPLAAGYLVTIELGAR